MMCDSSSGLTTLSVAMIIGFAEIHEKVRYFEKS